MGKVSENRVMRKTFGFRRKEMTRGLRRLHNEQHHNLSASPSIIRIFMSRRMRLVGHIACMR
jgi:hypothetical protein